MVPEKTPETDRYWAAFLRESGMVADDYAVAIPGDTPRLIDELLALVLSGRKRATASLLRDYGDDNVPKVGDFVVVLNGAGEPSCIWRSTEITVRPFIEVDDAFAWDEGEGDRSRDYWLSVHRAYYARQAEREGFTMHDRIENVFERFEIVWPPQGFS